MGHPVQRLAFDINYYSFLKEGHFARSWHNNLWKYPNMSAALEVSLRVNQRKSRPIIYGNWKKIEKGHS